MKNFDLNACGVQEMNAAEVAEVNGGFNDYMDVNRTRPYVGYKQELSWLDIFLTDWTTQMQWLR